MVQFQTIAPSNDSFPTGDQSITWKRLMECFLDEDVDLPPLFADAGPMANSALQELDRRKKEEGAPLWLRRSPSEALLDREKLTELTLCFLIGDEIYREKITFDSQKQQLLLHHFQSPRPLDCWRFCLPGTGIIDIDGLAAELFKCREKFAELPRLHLTPLATCMTNQEGIFSVVSTIHLGNLRDRVDQVSLRIIPIAASCTGSASLRGRVECRETLTFNKPFPDSLQVFSRFKLTAALDGTEMPIAHMNLTFEREGGGDFLSQRLNVERRREVPAGAVNLWVKTVDLLEKCSGVPERCKAHIAKGKFQFAAQLLADAQVQLQTHLDHLQSIDFKNEKEQVENALAILKVLENHLKNLSKN